MARSDVNTDELLWPWLKRRPGQAGVWRGQGSNKFDQRSWNPWRYIRYCVPQAFLGICEATLADLAGSGDWQLIETFREQLTAHLKTFLFVGGMPEAVVRFAERSALEEV